MIMKSKIPAVPALLAWLFALVFSAKAVPTLAESKPVTAVVLGDSFSSGQAGRWRGNAIVPQGGGVFGGNPFIQTFGTDGASQDGGNSGWVDPVHWDSVYEPGSIHNGCHRAYSAPIQQLRQPYFPLPPFQIRGPFPEVVNLACSGARNKHLWPLEHGGESQEDQAPQITRLDSLMQSNDVKLIVVGIGGNDMNFSNMIQSCIVAWATKHWTFKDNANCFVDIHEGLDSVLHENYGKVAKTIDLVRQTMTNHGKSDPDDYRIVLMGYPNIVAGISSNRYADKDRREHGRCPFTGPDSGYIDERMMPKFNAMYKALAHEKSVDVIDPESVLYGHRLCEHGSLRARPETQATPENMEWVRYIDHSLDVNGGLSSLVDLLFDSFGSPIYPGEQGRFTEAMHPNQFGQEALGSCIRKWWFQRNAAPGLFKCTNPNLESTRHVRVAAMAPEASAAISSNMAIPDGAPSTGPDGQGPEPGELVLDFTLSKENIGAVMLKTSARVELEIDHPVSGDLTVVLRNPAGEEYVIKGYNPSNSSPFPPVWRSYLPAAGLRPGEWTLTISDWREAHSGTFRDFRIHWY